MEHFSPHEESLRKKTEVPREVFPSRFAPLRLADEERPPSRFSHQSLLDAVLLEREKENGELDELTRHIFISNEYDG